jgi:hypothetical protein
MRIPVLAHGVLAFSGVGDVLFPLLAMFAAAIGAAVYGGVLVRRGTRARNPSQRRLGTAVLFAPLALMVFFTLAAGTEEFREFLGLMVFYLIGALVVMAFAVVAGPAPKPPDGSTNDGFNETRRLF